MKQFLIAEFQDSMGINAHLHCIWDGKTDKLRIPSGCHFALMVNGLVTYYRAVYDVFIQLKQTSVALAAPLRYVLEDIDGMYVEGHNCYFNIES